jgi:hypothetical protein
MGHIKEPKGVDFIINSRPETKEDEIAISKYIIAYKAKHARKHTPSKRSLKANRKKVSA